MGLRGAVGSLWLRSRTEYVKHDSEPPPEWRGAVRPSGEKVGNAVDSGIEVEEHHQFDEELGVEDRIEVVEQAIGVATVIETHFRIRCECGRRWWAMDLKPTSCPRCRCFVSIQSAD